MGGSQMAKENDFSEYTISKKETEEDILEEIWKMEEENEPVTIAEVARRFDISSKTAAQYIKKMAEHGYIERQPNSTRLRLTGLGSSVGKDCSYRHKALSLFLQSVGADAEEAEEKACRMEHIIGSDLVANICDLMLYGSRVEKTVKISNLNDLYAYGRHACMTGIYRDTGKFSHKLLLNYCGLKERGTLDLKEKDSCFFLPLEEKLRPVKMWYLERGGGWEAAKETDGVLELPAKALTFTASTFDYTAVGRISVSFGKTYEAMEKKEKLELMIRVLE